MAAIVRTHRPIWRAERCLPCRTCTRRCPTAVFPEQVLEPDSLRGRVAREVAFPPGRPDVPPCRAACPIGQDVPGYTTALAQGDFARALAVIAKTNPLPSVCGRLCLHACMHACVRAGLDAPVEIRALKRAALEHGGPRPVARPAAERDGRVVVVGAGPAGLSAAFALRRNGWQVELREAASEPGGLLRWAVPAFDLPRAALQAEIEAVLAAGIALELGARVGSLAELQGLQRAGARAVLLATGAGLGRRLGIPGEELVGAEDGLGFARRHADGLGPRLEGPLVVYGAGLVAVAAARLAVRAGAGPVRLVFTRPSAEAPRTEALDRAREEGVELVPERRPVELLGEAGRLRAVRLAPALVGPPDGVGRRWPVLAGEARGALLELEARVFVAAEDRAPDLGWLAGAPGLRLGPLGHLEVERGSYATGLPGVFACGEVMTGPRNAIEAIATGIRAAAAVERHLRAAQGQGGAS
ncbi:MAG TPA: FAD-dependent oxidoreductase [Myxococcota bacterium]|nr:FAD-dependent oxidoreductase [Myxococcota bacterium]HRY96371.1 FAD-dependent oxidoreductase [Myxococcota bacterium]HSA23474.1 FAD-dependent oxidoreductase [Myxococcota bacterium]